MGLTYMQMLSLFHRIRSLLSRQAHTEEVPTPAVTDQATLRRRKQAAQHPASLLQHDAIGARAGWLGGPGIDGQAAEYRKASNRVADRRAVFPRGVVKPTGAGKAAGRKQR